MELCKLITIIKNLFTANSRGNYQSEQNYLNGFARFCNQMSTVRPYHIISSDVNRFFLLSFFFLKTCFFFAKRNVGQKKLVFSFENENEF